MYILVVLLVISTTLAGYFYYRLHNYDGSITLGANEDGIKTYFLDLYYDPEELNDKRRIIFKVVVGVDEDF